jgi:hypothetical protein
MVTLAKIGLHALLIALATGAVHAQESGRELLGKARNLNLDELLKPYNAPSSAPPSAAREIKQERTLTPAEAAAAEIKRQARPLAYQAFAREPQKYTGATVSLRGKVVQAVESYGNMVLRVDVTPGQYDVWKDTVYVEYRRRSDTEPRVLDKDIVAIWGKFEGIKSYTTVMGATVQIPYVTAAILEPSSPPPEVVTGPGYHRRW